ncbi:DUF2971 domain-containing protein [Mesorhizobium sp. LNHC209A00]|uniref:DUF2971 domain-containing protein n=1 Tax=Mesorhizobium TaxID=68287 RepID=UPI0018DCF598|nr:DUF2971 domain-containing protein [Mesorhizobium sp. LNHC209A00]
MTAEIETYAIPYNLYRYRSLRRIGKPDKEVLDRELRSIEQSSLWCSDFDNMNDPMEGAFEPSAAVKENRRYAELAQTIRDGKLGYGMCAFSEAKDIELMWAHYADEFRGVCVSYSFRSLRYGLGSDKSFTRLCYSDSPPRVVNTTGPQNDILRILSTKHYRWQYEREWRLFTPVIGLNQYHRKLRNRPVVTRVYAGYRMDPSVRQEIFERMNAIKIPVYVMSLENYSIKFRLIRRPR